MSLPPLTLGIEEEYQIIDPESRELKSYIQELMEQGQRVLHDQIKKEFLQSQVEVGSQICHNIQELREEVVRLRSSICKLAASNGLRVAAASTHPFSAWASQDISIGERYTQLRTDMAELARRMLIFGMHVHVGIEDKELLIDVMNQTRYFLPHLLALTTSSPFWQGRDTGLKSYRTVISRACHALVCRRSLARGLTTTVSSTRWSRPDASTSRPRFGGTYGHTLNSRRLSFGSVTFAPRLTRPCVSQR